MIIMNKLASFNNDQQVIVADYWTQLTANNYGYLAAVYMADIKATRFVSVTDSYCCMYAVNPFEYDGTDIEQFGIEATDNYKNLFDYCTLAYLRNRSQQLGTVLVVEYSMLPTALATIISDNFDESEVAIIKKEDWLVRTDGTSVDINDLIDTFIDTYKYKETDYLNKANKCRRLASLLAERKGDKNE